MFPRALFFIFVLTLLRSDPPSGLTSPGRSLALQTAFTAAATPTDGSGSLPPSPAASRAPITASARRTSLTLGPDQIPSQMHSANRPGVREKLFSLLSVLPAIARVCLLSRA
jgi:hypothetical protein